MKLKLFILLCCVQTVNATAFSQEQKLDVAFDNELLVKVIDYLQDQTGLQFFYQDKSVSVSDRVSVNMKQATLSEILDKVLTGKGYAYELLDGVVVIKPMAARDDEKPKSVRVKGFVYDTGKLPMPGVTVKVVGLNIGTSTNAQGWFALELPMVTGTLEFSFIGFKKKTVAFTEKIAKDTLRITMEEDVTQINEVVVTGYQQIDKRHLTSAVTTVKMEDIDVPGVNRLDAMLEGRIPGLTFMQNTGQVGAAPKLRIRGTSTILGSQEPLWVVDGIIQQDPVNIDPQQLNDLDFVNLLGNAISGLNPDDIEQIDVLKDAAATALYGSRAANGVIVVTTRKGKVGPPRVSYSMSGTLTLRPRYSDRGFNMMNSRERVDVSRELMESGVRYTGTYGEQNQWVGVEQAYIDYYKNGSINFNEFQRRVHRYETMNTDWLDILTNDSFSNSHTLSINGGSEHARYYASIGYSDEQGNVLGESNKRYTLSMKTQAFWNEKFSAMFSSNMSVADRKYNPSDVNVMSYATKMNRALPLREENGDLWFYKTVNATGYQDQYSHMNIINEINESDRTIDQNTISLTGQVQYNFSEAFKLTGTGSFSFAHTQEETWYGENSDYISKLRADGGMNSTCPFGGVLSTNATRSRSYTFRLEGNYTKSFGNDGKHMINTMLGYELSSTKYNGTSEEQRGYYKDRGMGFVDLSDLTANDLSVSSNPTETTTRNIYFYLWRVKNFPTYTQTLTNMMSAYLTLTYCFDDRYILNFNTRADWSNSFGDRSNEKLFPVWSLSGRWNISDDIDVHWIDNLALKLSYGMQGNMPSGQPTRTTITKGDYNTTYGNYSSTILNYKNPNLKWEKTHSWNAGLDFSVLNGAIQGTVSVYYKKTTDAFLTKRVASVNGITSYVVNAGNVENKGVELSLTFTPINNALSANGKRGFVWRLDPQIGQTLNQLINRAVSQTNDVLQDELTVSDLLNGTGHVAGTPLNTFYSYRYKKLDNEGIPTFYGLEDENQGELRKQYTSMAAGDKKNVWMAVLEESGTRVPVIQGGINNYFSYRNFSLSVNFTYSLGNKIRLLKLCSGDYSAINPQPYNNLRKEFVNRWRFPGDEERTNIPALRTKITYQGSTEDVYRDYGWWRNEPWSPTPGSSFSKYDMYDNSNLRVASGNYLRLSSLVFRYTFDEKFLNKIGLSSAYLSLSGTNLFTLCSSKLKGQNPEQSGTTDIVNITIRPTFSVSLNVNF
ncbi:MULTISPECIES: SusC/RagA family TonB-linked outer membrane protein [Butyricimonas]|uniref:SusC/RagA family TonB-linked outer membrane protein n=1 Tax=Butyricimonas TaxID=574697 RepID=UPI001E543003|nr:MULTISPECIES: SusC/RagA family TonB-linked outer membrane protein [Butyricimonas]